MDSFSHIPTLNLPQLSHSFSLMDMTKNMNPRLSRLQVLPDGHRSHILFLHSSVQYALSWPMSDQQIYRFGHSFPYLLHFSCLDLKCSVPVWWYFRVRATKYFNAFQLYHLMVQEQNSCLGQSLSLTVVSHIFVDMKNAEMFIVHCRDIGIKKNLMISWYQDFMCEVKLPYYIDKFRKMGSFIICCEVTRMDEYITMQSILMSFYKLVQFSMSVRNGSQLYYSFYNLWGHRLFIVVRVHLRQYNKQKLIRKSRYYQYEMI